MKRNFTLAIIILLVIKANAQVMLNEVYPIPGAGRHEFFELFNNGTGSAPVSMDHYTLFTYFEEAGNQTGFYVLDLPDMPVPSQSYFVGASATPFNYQGINNSNSAQFSWNDSAFLNVNNGYLKKWYASSNIPAAIDGNDYYDLAATPANLNNFFYKVGGGNASYGVFLYRGGTLVNCFLGGVGGSNNMPSYILSMPLLHINMMGSAPDFDIVFSGYTNTPFESVTQEVGTDNGYIRLRDGFCGSWNKSSATVNHTPGFTNGGSGFEAATISVAAVVVPGNATTGSNANYDVVGAPVTSFPITMQIITDVGTSPSLLDAGDTLAGQNTENIITDGPFTT
ncbi:MAG: hypothetical protein H0U44_06255, partial [Flavisolibacter sp.]|nr:hypothetical protein [Flavisolibacter sp.]